MQHHHQNSAAAALQNSALHCPAHLHAMDSVLHDDDLEKMPSSGDYFLKPDPDLFCTLDRKQTVALPERAHNANSSATKVDKNKYGVLQQH